MSIWFGRPHRGRARSILASRSVVPPLVGIAGVCRVAPSHPRRRRRPGGEPRWDPESARVRTRSPAARGGRRLRTVDLDLIQRPASPRTASGAPAADGRAPLVSWAGLLSHALRTKWARTQQIGPDPLQIWPEYIFFSEDFH
jgi:hypothetical protein